MKASQEVLDTYRSEFFKQGAGTQRQLRAFMALTALVALASSNLWQAQEFHWTHPIQPFGSLLILYFSVFIWRAPGWFFPSFHWFLWMWFLLSSGLLLLRAGLAWMGQRLPAINEIGFSFLILGICLYFFRPVTKYQSTVSDVLRSKQSR